MKILKSKNLILILGAILIVTISIWLPGFLMQREIKTHLFETSDVPSEYYSAPSDALIKNASKQLTKEQCLRLIMGTWESTISPTTEENCSLNQFGIKTIAINRIDELYSRGIYPTSLSSKTDDMYTWSATPYRALDATFQTYAAYYWDVRFTKNDGSESHRIIVTEAGDILYAELLTDKNKAVDSDSTTTDVASFETKLTNSSYLISFYGEFTTTTRNDEAIRITEHGTSVTSFRTSKASEAQIASIDTSKASYYISEFKDFVPDEIYALSQISGQKVNKYLVCCKKDADSYRIVLLPEE